MKEFVKEFASKMGMDTSEMLRMMIDYYFMSYFSRTGSYEEIRQKFFRLYPSEEYQNEALKKGKMGK